MLVKAISLPNTCKKFMAFDESDLLKDKAMIDIRSPFGDHWVRKGHDEELIQSYMDSLINKPFFEEKRVNWLPYKVVKNGRFNYISFQVKVDNLVWRTLCAMSGKVRVNGCQWQCYFANNKLTPHQKFPVKDAVTRPPPFLN